MIGVDGVCVPASAGFREPHNPGRLLKAVHKPTGGRRPSRGASPELGVSKTPLFEEEILEETETTVTRRMGDGSINQDSKGWHKTIPRGGGGTWKERTI